MIPDGLLVKLAVYKNEKLMNQIIETSKNGFVSFSLNSNIYDNDLYTIQITTAGITKTFQSKKLW